MHQRISKKVTIYFLLFIFISSVNNNVLNRLNFEKIIKFNISGLDNNEILNITKSLNKLNLSNIFSIKKNEVLNIINSNNLIEKYYIFKKYPSTLDVKIDETTYLAKININGKILTVGSNGKLIDSKQNNDYLPYIFGKPEIDEFLEFKKIIDESKYSYKQIKNFYFYPSKRWDLELKNNIIIKLSKLDLIKSLNQSYEFLNHEKFKDIKIIDARIKNQIIIK